VDVGHEWWGTGGHEHGHGSLEYTDEAHPFTIESVSKPEEGLVLFCKRSGQLDEPDVRVREHVGVWGAGAQGGEERQGDGSRHDINRSILMLLRENLNLKQTRNMNELCG